MLNISIIIPTCNRAEYLKEVLHSILIQLYDADKFEVIVIDNGSADETKQICDEYSLRIKNFVYRFDAIPGLLTGRHKGAEIASGDILAFIDDDVELDYQWLKGINSVFSNNADVHLATGPCLPKYYSYPPEWMNEFWTSTPYGGKMCTWLSSLDLGASEIEIDPLYVFGLNYAIRKSTFFGLGGFHPDNIPATLQQFQGDGETGLSLKAREANYKALYSPSALLYHSVPPERLSIDYFEKRAFYQGVCDSFTKIRSENGLYKAIPQQESTKKKFLSHSLDRLRNILKGKNLQTVSNTSGNCFKGLHDTLDKKYKEGYYFHQTAFENDSSVRNWSLRENYWNYKLPGYD